MESHCRKEIIEILHSEVKPALGCTEPIAVALAVAKACEELSLLGVEVGKIKVEVSANILKNGMGVGIPGTGMVGLNVASALASVCGKSAYGLEVLKDLCPKSVEKAKEMLDGKMVEIALANTTKKLYIAAYANGKGKSGEVHTTKCVVMDNHDSIVYVEADGKVVIDNMPKEMKGEAAEIQDPRQALTLDRIYEFATTALIDEIDFLYEAVELNRALADEGLKNEYGLQVGRTIMAKHNSDVFCDDMLCYCMAITAAASDARMAGCVLPAMSNSGSGNQGITVTLPVVAASEKLASSRENLLRALAISHLVAIHIKSYLGKLSALCGCVIASTGSSCGIVYLKGGSFQQICYSVKNMIGNITGMVCDGAKVGCAMKVASGVSSSVQSAMLALDDICISSNDGIIEDDIERTIRNLGRIGSVGMQKTDDMILHIMVEK